MRNGDTLSFSTRSSETVQPFPMYLFNETHTDSKQIAVPHPTRLAPGHLPPGGRHGCAGTQYLPPGGRGTAKRWMRIGGTFLFSMQSNQAVQAFPMYLFYELQTNSEHFAVPHQSRFARQLPPGGSYGAMFDLSSRQRWEMPVQQRSKNTFPRGKAWLCWDAIPSPEGIA